MSKKTDTLALIDPIEVDGKVYSSLTFRRAKARDLLAADAVQGQLRKSMAIFASICNVSIGVIEDLSMDDFEAVGTKAAEYMGKRGREQLAKARMERRAIRKRKRSSKSPLA